MRQGRGIGLAVALTMTAGTWVATADTVAHAAGSFTVVDGPGTAPFDASDDGRYILTSALADVVTGQRTPLPATVKAQRISGDGRLVFFVSNAQLTAADTDAEMDVYSYSMATATIRLISTGFPGWAFNIDGTGGGFTNGDVDQLGDVAIYTGTSGNFGAGVFVNDAATVTRVAGVSTSVAEGYGISDNGRYILYRSGQDMFVEDRTTSTPVQVNAAGVSPWAAELSGDGRHVAMVVGQPGAFTTSLRDLDTGVTISLGTFDTQYVPIDGLGISADGAAVSFLRNTPTDTPSGVTNLPQLYVWSAGMATLMSAPDAGRADGMVERGFVVADGAMVVFSSEADNLVAGVQPPTSIYIKRFGAAANPPPPPTPAVAAAYTPSVPVRVLDTRADGPQVGYTGPRPGLNSTIAVAMTQHGVPATASAVAVQVTATDGTSVGFVGLTPVGSPTGRTSNLNLDTVGETIANLAIVPLGPDGGINVFTSASTHLVLDLLGWWTPAPGAVSAGRYVPVTPTRLLDTRPETLTGYNGTKPGTNSTTVIQVNGRGDIPATGVRAVAVNITLDATTAPGFVQAAPADTLDPGATSTVNVSTAGQVVAAASIVLVDANGQIALYSQNSTHLIVDVTGWFTDSTAPASTSGRFVPATSITRTLDTRPDSRVGWIGPKPTPTTTLTNQGTGMALVGNLTITETSGPGFVQLGPATVMTAGTTSSINATTAGETIANAFISPVAPDLGIYTIIGTHVLLDISGYMTN